jgi:uncharacterized protein YdgA (DUF945 family)
MCVCVYSKSRQAQGADKKTTEACSVPWCGAAEYSGPKMEPENTQDGTQLRQQKRRASKKETSEAKVK